MAIQRINPPDMDSSRRNPRGLTQVVRVGDTVYISGQTPMEGDSVVGIGDIDAQANHVYGSLEAALKSVGGGLDNLVKITAYISRPEYYRAIVNARGRFLGPNPAASSTVVVPTLGRPNVGVEIDAIAVVGATGSKKESIDPPGLPKPENHGMLVRVGDVIYICGLISWDSSGNIVGIADFAAQAKQLYANLDVCLKYVGATRDDVVKTTTFYTHPFQYPEVRKARESFYGPNPPTSAALMVSHLVNPDALLEIESIAVIGGEKRHLNPDTMNKPTGYTNVVQAGNTVYIAGQAATDVQGNLVGTGDPGAQAGQLFACLDAAVKAAGGTSQNIAKTTTYFTRTDYFPSVQKGREEFYGDSPPSGTQIPVSGLVHPDMLVEIEAIAALD